MLCLARVSPRVSSGAHQAVPPNKAFSERHPEPVKKRHFPQKQQLFDLTLCRQQDVLSWKMIAHHHSMVHRTAGSLRVFNQFVWLEVGSGKVELFRPPTSG
jgi:hypothetical protein